MTVKLYTREPTYTVKIFDLGVARTNELVTFNGQLIIVKEITGDATIKFNNVVNDEISLTEMQGKTSIIYNRFYITNVAQVGKTLKLLAGRDMDFESGNDVSIPVSNHNSSVATPLTVTLIANGKPNLEVWVKSSAAAVFNVSGSFDNINWRKFDELTLNAIGELHRKYTNAYNFIKVETTALNNNEIEIVAGR